MLAVTEFRLMQTNALHGLLAEYGEVMRTGHASLVRNIP